MRACPYCKTASVVEDGYCAQCRQVTLPPSLAAQAASPKDWVQDFGHENGKYLNRCARCASTFRGHKRRFLCRQCWDACGAYEMPDGPGE